MSDTLQTDRPLPRKASRDVRRRQLIEATLDSLSIRGFAGTTMAHVTAGAGLSRGIANFHFESKEKLLEETMKFLAADYEDHWRTALKECGPGAAERLWALMEADFHPRVCNVRYIAAWAALRAEAQSRPAYQAISGRSDEAFDTALEEICSAIVEEGGYNLDPVQIAMGLSSLNDGLGMSYLMTPEAFSERDALACVQEYLAGLFPKHFTRSGPIRTA